MFSLCINQVIKVTSRAQLFGSNWKCFQAKIISSLFCKTKSWITCNCTWCIQSVNVVYHSLEENDVSYAWMAWVYQPSITNDPTLLTNNKGSSSSIIRRITNHYVLCDPLKNHLNVLLWVVLHNECTNGLCNLLENRYNLRNLADHGIGSNIRNLFMLHITSYKLVVFSCLCAHGKVEARH